MLRDIYASESAVVPTQANEPLATAAPSIRRKPLCS
jgi:hypothetical protein